MLNAALAISGRTWLIWGKHFINFGETMLKILQTTTLAAILLAGSSAMAWSTTTISGTGFPVGKHVQRYAWRDLGGGAWQKWNSVAFAQNDGGLSIARRSASNTSSAWSSWTVEDIDTTTHDIIGISSAIGTPDGAEFVSYVEQTTGDLKFARRVGSGAGNCFSGSNWDCTTVVSTPVTNQRVEESSIGVVYDDSTQSYTIHIVYTFDDGDASPYSLRYARKVGGAAWSTALIRNTASVWLGPDALATVGNSPLVAYGESGQGLQVSEFLGPAMGTWGTTTVDSTSNVTYASMDTALLNREVAYLAGYPTRNLKAARYNWISGSWSKTTVDTSVREEVSLAIDGNGDPHIGYQRNELQGDRPWRAKRTSGVWANEVADSLFHTGSSVSIQIDKQLAVEKAILVHGNGFGTIRVSTE
jgi:hypothetical protein